jgi:3-hydroxy-9,10-secoandrosta-1,3,5(10)-triene-9,17-dione monooxygenase reductase component
METHLPPFEPRKLRNAFGRFPSGVTVITTRSAEGKPEGLTANSFAALSLDPPMVLWSLGKNANSLPSFLKSGHFAINVLGSRQADLSHRFATPSADKFASVETTHGVGGCPILPDVLASFECETQQSLEAGDHILFIGRVLRFGYRDGPPLGFSAGQYASVNPLPRPEARSDAEAIWSGLG